MDTQIPAPNNPEEGHSDKKEFRMLKKQHKEEEQRRQRRRQMFRRALTIGATVAVVGGGVFGLARFVGTRPNLPPTDLQGHIEDMPKTHITDEPIPESIQRHMLEHADGKGKPGVIVQYNCRKYSCAGDLVEKLTALVKQYPDNVYLAPNDYDGMIILTKLGSQKILNGFDEQAIKDFIAKN